MGKEFIELFANFLFAQSLSNYKKIFTNTQYVWQEVSVATEKSAFVYIWNFYYKVC